MGKINVKGNNGEVLELEVNESNYIELAGRTNNPEYDKVSERMLDSGAVKVGVPLLLESVSEVLDRDLDSIKKHLFYGKELGTNMPREMYEIHAPFNFKAGRTMEAFAGNEEMIDIFHGVIGLATEVGEMLKALTAYMETGKLDKVNLGEEVGDLTWYMALILKRTGLSFEQVMMTNIKKLYERYPDKFTEHHAINRNLEAERNILENDLARQKETI